MSLWVCCPSASTGCGKWGQNRKANGIPTFKKVEKEDPGNYKLSSLSSVSWKITSSWKLFLSSWSVRRWLETGSMNLPRANCPWSAWLADHGKMTGSVGKGSVVNMVYLNFSKAFPKVFDSILPVNIVRYGQDNQVIKWLENWLN